MYENLSIQEYLKRMQEWDDKRNNAAKEWIEENWKPIGDPYVWENGLTGQFYQLKEETLKKMRGDENGNSQD